MILKINKKKFKYLTQFNMRWNKKSIKPIPIKPTLGSMKTKTKFAWLPIEINEQYVWLEKYIETKEYKNVPQWKNTDGSFICNNYGDGNSDEIGLGGVLLWLIY